MWEEIWYCIFVKLKIGIWRIEVVSLVVEMYWSKVFSIEGIIRVKSVRKWWERVIFSSKLWRRCMISYIYGFIKFVCKCKIDLLVILGYLESIFRNYL